MVGIKLHSPSPWLMNNQEKEKGEVKTKEEKMKKKKLKRSALYGTYVPFVMPTYLCYNY